MPSPTSPANYGVRKAGRGFHWYVREAGRTVASGFVEDESAARAAAAGAALAHMRQKNTILSEHERRCPKCLTGMRLHALETVAGPAGRACAVRVFACPACGRLEAQEIQTPRQVA